MLKRCEDTNLSLNWEKSHFMVVIAGTNQKLSAPIKRQVHLPPTPERTTSPMVARSQLNSAMANGFFHFRSQNECTGIRRYDLGSYRERRSSPLMTATIMNIEKALDSLLKGSERGSMMAMMDAWLVYWDIRKKEEGVRMEAGMFFWLPVADLQSDIDGVL
ncbi:hypothetical protein Tco_1123747 [Tanacetum coccineum]|uniref:Reverse transcriptase domain-containing protein n=1 Tax=Tanacetum coccineum TaxID=301880 RepID=A0ABQ5J477_9ASTR